MKAKVLERLKLKAKDFGFTDEELKTVCDPIANQLAQKEDASDDDIDAAVDSYLPILKLSQSASNRSFEKMKKQFEDEQKKKNPPTEKKEETKKEEKKDEEPEWFKSYRTSMEQKLAEQQQALETYKKEKNNEGYLSKVKKDLKDVDPSFYSLMLEGKTFANEEEANTFVSKVNEGWTKFCKDRNIEAIKKVVPPAGGEPEPAKPSEGVLKRIEERKKKAEALKDNSGVFKGLPNNV